MLADVGLAHDQLNVLGFHARFVHRVVGSPARLGSTALTEPQAGSDFAAITTSAEKVSDGWVLNGTKAWIVNTAASDVIAVYAQTEGGAGGGGRKGSASVQAAQCHGVQADAAAAPVDARAQHQAE